MNIDEKTLGVIESKLKEAVDASIEQNLAKAVSPMVAAETRKIVEQMRIERALFGVDRSGLTEDQKKSFAEAVKSIGFGEKVKANEALIEETDARGGYLVAPEVANAILRIAASVGLVAQQAQKWGMKTDELNIPAYTGSFLEGEFLGVDAAGSATALSFAEAKLVAKRWQLAFVVANDLLSDAQVNLADWLLALGGEALANRIDKEGLAGTGLPFIGVLNHSGVTVHTFTTGKDTFAEFDFVEASDMIANLEESMLDGAAFYMHRTVWAKVRSQKDTDGNYVFGYQNTDFASLEKQTGIKPAGYILGYPVYTTRHLPANSATAVSTKFVIFGNLKGLAYGVRDNDMRYAQHTSGSFGGKEIALADQTGMVMKNRWATVVALPAAFVVGKTAAS